MIEETAYNGHVLLLANSDIANAPPASSLVALEHVYQQLQEQIKLQQEELVQHRERLVHELLSTPYDRNTIGSAGSTRSFTQGLILGQLSVIFVVGVFIKFFVFAENAPVAPSTASKDASGVIVKRKKKDPAGNSDDADLLVADGDDASPHSKLTTILEKTYYDVDNHASESLDWFNVLVAQTISQLRSEALLADNIYHSLNDFLAHLELPDFLDKIRVTEIDIGDDFPIFSNCRINHSKDGTGRLDAKIDVDLSDTLTLGVETRLLLNHPRPLTAILPVLLSVSIVRFSGCLTVSLINTNDPEFVDLKSSANGAESPKKAPSSAPMSHASSTSESSSEEKTKKHDPTGTALMFSFSPDYRLEFVVKSLIGSRAKLEDVPKISSLVENRLRSWFIERCIEPRFQVVRLPSIWPRRKNTREPVHSNTNGMADTAEDIL